MGTHALCSMYSDFMRDLVIFVFDDGSTKRLTNQCICQPGNEELREWIERKLSLVEHFNSMTPQYLPGWLMATLDKYNFKATTKTHPRLMPYNRPNRLVRI